MQKEHRIWASLWMLLAFGALCGCSPDASFDRDRIDASIDAEMDAGDADIPTCAENEHVVDNACVACPINSTNAEGDDPAGDNTACECDPDHSVVDNECVMCGPGLMRPAGDPVPGDDTMCGETICEANERVQDNACVMCPMNATNMMGDDASMGDTSCECEENFQVVDNACVSCPAGTTRMAGDAVPGSNTMCEPTLCMENQFVMGNACQLCPAGTTNAAGDDASMEDTMCDATLCAPDQRVSSNACVPCMAGQSNVMGDDASGGDTMCDPVACPVNSTGTDVVSGCTCNAGTTGMITPSTTAPYYTGTCAAVPCAANEYVSSNTCTACPPGTTNAAGDDESGVDTTCDDVSCPSNSTGASLAAGCTCVPGYGGTITATTTGPDYYTGSCTANACTGTEVANSDFATAGAITGSTGTVVTVTCNAGFSGGGA
ncbi:MAG: hypothetical protein VX223_18755, partial [Myxococcota bacterium]|nr:hypothetical protein [Myxococcota bacterium]